MERFGGICSILVIVVGWVWAELAPAHAQTFAIEDTVQTTKWVQLASWFSTPKYPPDERFDGARAALQSDATDPEDSTKLYYTCYDGAAKAGDRAGLAEVFKEHKNSAAFRPEPGESRIDREAKASNACALAEAMRRLGDYGAGEAYETAIELAPREPGYELLYGEYLRNFRGAASPLFQKAEDRLLRAKKKTSAQYGPRSKMAELVKRALINLYQNDGIALFAERAGEGQSSPDRPLIFFATTNEYADRTTDPDEVDDVRNFTSEALFAESLQRLNRPLTASELRRIARSKPQFDSLSRLRYRPSLTSPIGELFSAVDVFARYRHTEDAQITNFFQPGRFNDLELSEIGIAAEKSFAAGEWDGFLRGSYKYIRREGLIEFRPEATETINHFEANAALSHFIGPDKLTLEGVYVYQDIDQDLSVSSDRDRQIAGASLSYLKALDTTFNSRFATRGLEFFSGFLFDRDSFGSVDIDKWDFFVGVSRRGFGFGGKDGDNSPSSEDHWFSLDDSFDLTVQPTVFTSSVDNDSTQDNAQYRTNVNLVWRILDEEKVQGLRYGFLDDLYPAFVHLTIPFRHDLAIDGPDSFENWSIGAELSTKAFAITPSGGPSFRLSALYRYQDFYNLDESDHQFALRLALGF